MDFYLIINIFVITYEFQIKHSHFDFRFCPKINAFYIFQCELFPANSPTSNFARIN